MAKNSLNSELFGATNLFDNLTKEFRDGVELKNHSRRLKSYKNCFIAYKGVNFLFDLLKSKDEFSGKIKHRDQAINLMNIFLKWGIIVRIYPSANMVKFQDNKDLFTIGQSDESNLKENEKSYENISKSTNDLLTNHTINVPFKAERSTLYRSFRSSTYDQLNQLQNTIKKTTSTIFKSTNNNVTKLANQTFNKFNNRSANNLIKKLNNNFNRTNNSIKRSTSCVSKNNRTINRPITRSFSQQEKENNCLNDLNGNTKFVRNYRCIRTNNRSINSSSMNATFNSLKFKNNSSFHGNQKVSFNPMNGEKLCLECVETDGNNLLRFLNKLSDNIRKKPLKVSNSNPVPMINDGSQIILRRDQVQYIPNFNSSNLLRPSIGFNQPQIINRMPAIDQKNQFHSHFNRRCATNPISSTCYNTLV